MTSSQLSALPTELNITGEIESGDVYLNGNWLSPEMSQRICNHWPNGFMWGKRYGGREQLALAILMEFLPVKLALEYYQDFKYKFISELPETNFDVTLNLKTEIEEIMNIKIMK